MYTRRNIRWSVILRFGWTYIIFFILYGTTIVVAHKLWKDVSLGIPMTPLSIIGIAVAFYLGFKNNSSYDRLWEARRVWGALVNSSRTWAVQVLHFIKEDERKPETARKLIYRHLAFLTALRLQLRRPTFWERGYIVGQQMVDREEFQSDTLEAELERFLPEGEAMTFALKRNAATQLLAKQSEQIAELKTAGELELFYHVEMSRTIAELYNQQGAAERIKSFPFPRQYAYFSFVFVWMFLALLPFGLIGEFLKLGEDGVWLVIPAYVLIAFIFNTMEIVGATSENPFENSVNDVPITAICRVIEIDLKEMLGEIDLPKRLEPVDDFLM